MPANTKKQERFLRGCEKNPQKMRGKCPSKADARRALGKHGPKKKAR